MWGDFLANKRILFFIDNGSAMHVISRQTSKNTELLYLLRQLVLTCLWHDILFRVRHIRETKKILADSPSRLQVGRFKTLSKRVQPLHRHPSFHRTGRNAELFVTGIQQYLLPIHRPEALVNFKAIFI